MSSSHFDIDTDYTLHSKMVILKTGQEELSNNSILRREIIFIYPRYLKFFILITVNFQLSISSLPKKDCSQSSKNHEVHGLEIVKRFFIQKEDLSVYISSEGDPARG